MQNGWSKILLWFFNFWCIFRGQNRPKNEIFKNLIQVLKLVAKSFSTPSKTFLIFIYFFAVLFKIINGFLNLIMLTIPQYKSFFHSPSSTRDMHFFIGMVFCLLYTFLTIFLLELSFTVWIIKLFFALFRTIYNMPVFKFQKYELIV